MTAGDHSKSIQVPPQIDQFRATPWPLDAGFDGFLESLRLGSDWLLRWANQLAGGESKQNMNHELTAGSVDKHRHTDAQCQSHSRALLESSTIFSYLRTVLLAFATLSQQPICGLIAGSASAS